MQRAPFHPILAELYASEKGRLPDDTVWWDAHTHIGQNDPDGVTGTVEELYADLDEAGHAGATVFAMHEPDGYPGPNTHVREVVAGSDGRLRAFARISPNSPDALDEARRAVAEGTSGFKLHPRSDAFGLPHPSVDGLAEIAAEAKLPILIHAGRGIPHLGVAATDLCRRHPDLNLILAHAGVSDLGWIAPSAAELPNLFFDTSWWQASDMLTLFTTVPPQNIVFASDSPYGRCAMAGVIFLRAGRAAGLSPEQLSVIAGKQMINVLDGGSPIELGPAPGPLTGERNLPAERAMSYICMAVMLAFRGGDPTEPMALARVACQHPPEQAQDPVLAIVDELVAEAESIPLQSPEELVAGIRWRGGELLICAQVLAGTASAGV